MRRHNRRPEIHLGGRRVSPYKENPAHDVYLGGRQDIPASITLSGGATRTITLQGTNGAVVYAHFGDGSSIANYTLLGTGVNVPVSHAYAAGTYTMRIYGALEDVTYFDGNSITCSKVSGFDHFINNTLVYLYVNNLTTIPVLGNSDALQTINISSNSIVDISSVANLTSLVTLNAHINSISDISAVANLTSLQVLQFHTNSNIDDISAIENLNNLTLLYCFVCNIQTLPATFPAWDSIDFRAYNNSNFPTSEWLLKLDTAGVSNSTLRADGTCPAHDGSAEVLAAIASLITNGCTVTVNAP